MRKISFDFNRTRPIELYIGVGGDFGTWKTISVEVPIDTPDSLLEDVAISKCDKDYQFIGLYNVPPIEEAPYEEITWHDMDDRYIYIKIDYDGKMLGMNYMQGDEFDIFIKDYYKSDDNLTNFWNVVKQFVGGDTLYEQINNAIWLYVSLEDSEFKFKD